LAYKLVLTRTAIKESLKLEKRERDRVKSFLVEVAREPRSKGEPMQGRFKGEWRYKLGKLRILCCVDDERRELLVLRVRWRRGCVQVMQRRD